jgi:hypothetical protein
LAVLLALLVDMFRLTMRGVGTLGRFLVRRGRDLETAGIKRNRLMRNASPQTRAGYVSAMIATG